VNDGSGSPAELRKESVSVASTEERKLATVVFADLLASTELGAARDP
jgi:class 3 adenylate cyclase